MDSDPMADYLRLFSDKGVDKRTMYAVGAVIKALRSFSTSVEFNRAEGKKTSIFDDVDFCHDALEILYKDAIVSDIDFSYLVAKSPCYDVNFVLDGKDYSPVDENVHTPDDIKERPIVNIDTRRGHNGLCAFIVKFTVGDYNFNININAKNQNNRVENPKPIIEETFTITSRNGEISHVIVSKFEDVGFEPIETKFGHMFE